MDRTFDSKSHAKRAPICRKNSKQNENLSFHLFPKDYRKQLWMDALQLKQISSWNRVCSTQFSVQSYMNNGSRNVLVRDAIPFAIREFIHVHNDEHLNKSIEGTPLMESRLNTIQVALNTPVLTLIVNSKRKLFDSTSPAAKKNQSNSNRFGNLEVDHFGTAITGLKNENKCLTEKIAVWKSLECIINDLHSRLLISDAEANNLKALGSDVLNKLVANILDSKKSYSDEIRRFALTLHYYSPKAYEYPGFTQESLDAIRVKALEGPVYCNIVVDEMCVKKHIELDTCQNVYGLRMDYELDNDDIPQARNTLVFLVVGLNGYWKLPILYFLIDSLNGTERGNLLKTAIDLVKETDAYLKSVTIDGTNKIYMLNFKCDRGPHIMTGRAASGPRAACHGFKTPALEYYQILREEAYKLSQDHLETFFSAIRSRGGFNDNPICLQFQAAYKRLLVHNQITSFMYANCRALDSTVIIPVPPGNENSLNNINDSNDITADKINLDILSLYVDDVCSYIAGFVLQYNYHESHLSIIKDREGLKKESKDVISICKILENIF
ncbi:THAP-type domain-containing protein [Aphis craccivora]|uniref:THAP-type domain-containing protein n=1 Tax=Aphis craccivora TaxID=307492 RepID=A0A6G0Z5Z5_APHCR|nr:THAP-type domain-containing protein [Aphis craccivora]